jgi:hypothetical protein
MQMKKAVFEVLFTVLAMTVNKTFKTASKNKCLIYFFSVVGGSVEGLSSGKPV